MNTVNFVNQIQRIDDYFLNRYIIGFKLSAVVIIGADWCPSTKVILKDLYDLEKKWKYVLFAYAPVEECDREKNNLRVVSYYEITHYPTILGFKNGECVGKVFPSKAISKQKKEIKKLIREVA